MRKLACVLLWVWLLAVPVSALEIQAPAVPEAGRDFMPRNTDSLGAGLEELLEKAQYVIENDTAKDVLVRRVKEVADSLKAQYGENKWD